MEAVSAVKTCPATTRAEDMSQPPLAPDRAKLRARRGWPSRLAGQCPLTRHLKDPGGESISTHLGEARHRHRHRVVLVLLARVLLVIVAALARRALARA